jgi:hypothetical protein
MLIGYARVSTQSQESRAASFYVASRAEFRRGVGLCYSRPLASASRSTFSTRAL